MELKFTQRLLDKDLMIPLGCGASTAGLNSLFIKEISLDNAHDWGTEQVNDFIIRLAGLYGEKGKSIDESIEFLERKLNDENKFMSGDSLKDIVVSSLFNIISKTSGFSIEFTDGKLNIQKIEISENVNIVNLLMQETVNYAFSLIIKMKDTFDGNTVTGLPDHLAAFIRNVAEHPVIRKLSEKNEEGIPLYSVLCNTIFAEQSSKEKRNENLFDLSMALGIAHESVKTKQYLPVLINKILVGTYYFISRICMKISEMKTNEQMDLSKIKLEEIFPYKNPDLEKMNRLAELSFVILNVIMAAGNAFIHNKGDKKAFIKSFFQKINYIGIFAAAIHITEDMIADAEAVFEQCAAAAEEFNDVKAIGLGMSTHAYITMTSELIHQVQIEYAELEVLHEERVHVERECTEMIETLQEYRFEIEQAVTQYMTDHLNVFNEAFDQMDEALADKDVDRYLAGNAMIQEKLGKENTFKTQDEFDLFMGSDDAFKF